MSPHSLTTLKNVCFPGVCRLLHLLKESLALTGVPVCVNSPLTFLISVLLVSSS